MFHIRYNDLLERKDQRGRLSEVQKAFNALVLEALQVNSNVSSLLKSPLEHQCELALGKETFIRSRAVHA